MGIMADFQFKQGLIKKENKTLKQKLKLTAIAILRGLTPNFILAIVDRVRYIWTKYDQDKEKLTKMEESFSDFVTFLKSDKPTSKKRTRSKLVAKKAVPKKKAPAKKATSEKKPRKPRATKAEMVARLIAQAHEKRLAEAGEQELY